MRDAQLAALGFEAFVAVGLFAVDRLVTDIPDAVLLAVLALCGFGIALSMMLLLRSQAVMAPGLALSVTGDSNPVIGTTGDNSPVTISNSFNATPQEEATRLPWRERAGGPQFRLSPGIYQGRLLCDIQISNASLPPGGLQARWIGAGTNSDWTTAMRGNVPAGSALQKYQLKPVEMSPTPPADSVTLEIRFNLDDGPHGGGLDVADA